MVRRKTHKQFIQEMNEINPNIEILGEYETNSTPIECRCKIDGYIWFPRPNHLLQGSGCPKCYGNIKKTHEEFMKDFYNQNPNAHNIEILGEYVNNKTPIKCKCKIDGHEWTPIPNDLLSKGSGCPKCKLQTQIQKQTKTHEEFIQEMQEINPNIEILGEYQGSKTPIKCKCKIDGYEWTPTPNSLLREQGCPKCYSRSLSIRQTKTHEQFIQEMQEINPNIEILGEYEGSDKTIKCKCKIDGHEWLPLPSNLLNGSGCPKCNSSKGEKAISKYLKDNNMDFIEQHRFENCKHKNTLPFDFYLPNLNVAIEFDGADHYMIFTRSKNETYEQAMDRFIDRKIRDTIKTWYCEQNNVKLIRIPYWEFENIEEILNKELLEKRNKFIS